MAQWCAMLRSREGATAVFTALAVAVVLAVVAVGLEAGRLVHVQHQVQDIVDNAAIAAMLARRADPQADPTPVARAMLAQDSRLADGTAVVAIEWPPADGVEDGNADAIRIRAELPRPVRLGALIGSKPIRVGATGAARLVDEGQGCVLALSAGPAPTIRESLPGNLLTGGCSVLSIEAGRTATRLDDADPWTDVPLPVPAYCRFTGLNVGLVRVLKAGAPPWAFCGDTRIRGIGLVYLLPGIYAVTGRLTVESHAHLVGRKVTLVLMPGGSLDFQPGASIDLSAPDTGVTAGLVIAGTDLAAGASRLTGGASQSIAGAVHLPAQTLAIAGPQGGDCLQLTAHTINVTGPTRVGCTRPAVRPIRDRAARLYG
jgi:hypothetical protein